MVASVPDTRSYDQDFYADQLQGSLRSARVILPIVFSLIAPKKVVDVGAGQGAWLAAAEELGCTTLVGLDGNWVDRTRLMSRNIEFRSTDLSTEFVVGGGFDLCISVEVAEHLPAACAPSFVRALCGAADVVLFSAAVPFQGGTEHVNEERASRWIARFEAAGFVPLDLVRGVIWDNESVPYWYRQNVLLFANRDGARFQDLSNQPLPPMPYDVVHPEAFEERMSAAMSEMCRIRDRWERPTLRQALGVFWRALRT